MSSGIDKEFVRDYYQRMTDQEITRILKQNASGLTSEALEIIREEIIRRNLDPQIIRTVEAQQEVYTYQQKAYDPNSCPVDEPYRLLIENSFQTLLNIFGKENTIN